MTSPQPPPPPAPSTHPTATAPDVLTEIRTQIETNIPQSVDRTSSEYLRSALEAFKRAIDELDVWILRDQSQISGIEMQLPTVVHEYDGERRAKLEERLRVLTAEREELRTVRVALVGDRDDVASRLRASLIQQSSVVREKEEGWLDDDDEF